MNDIELARQKALSGKRKWFSFLYPYILQKINEGFSYEDISSWLITEHDITITSGNIRKYVHRSRKLNKASSEQTTSASAALLALEMPTHVSKKEDCKKIAQNHVQNEVD